MRVTDSIRHATIQRQNNKASLELQRSTERASTGVRVAAPKDDPASFSRIAVYDGVLARMDTRGTALTRANDDAAQAEAALASAGEIMSRIHELAVQMADGTMSANDRALGAKQVAQLRQELVGIANTKGGTGYLFGGTKTTTPPFTTAGVFSGNDNPILVETADGVTTQANISGAQAFTAAGGRDIFADLTSLEAALSGNNVAGIQTAIADSEAGRAQITQIRGGAGVTMDRLRTAQEVNAASKLAFSKMRSSEAEVDPIEAFSALSQAQQAYERSLEIARRSLSSFDIKNF